MCLHFFDSTHFRILVQMRPRKFAAVYRRRLSNDLQQPQGPQWVLNTYFILHRAVESRGGFNPPPRVGVGPWGKILGWYDQHSAQVQIWVQSNNQDNNTKLNPLLGLGQAPRVRIWVQSGSGWPEGSKIHQIFCFKLFWPYSINND